MPINEDTGEPDYARATPERTREFLYNESGLEADEADAYVGNNAEQAREELEKAKNSKPKMEKGKTLTQFLSEKAAWQQQMDEAQRNVDYWEGVKNAGQETAGEQRMSLRKNSLTIGEQAETAVNSAVERRKAESVQQDFSVTEISGEGNAENANGNEERNSYVNRRKVDDGTDGDLEQEITPAIGPFGEIYTQFKGKPQEAITYLLAKKGGEAVGALYHKDIGSIDIVWGEEGTGHSDGFGLAKLAKFHPEVLFNLQDILNDMVVTRRSENRVQLESEKYKASVRLTWDNKKKTWLLTMFEKKNSVLDNTTDTGKTLMGNGNDTATPENTVSSASKGRESVISDQGKSKKNAENQQEGAGNVENGAPEASLRNGRKPGNAKQENAGEASAKMRGMMERIAEKLGYRIEWYEAMEQNGLFDPKTKTIHIALDAENPLAAVFGHESMHKIAENAEDYKSILALAKEVLGEKEFERRVDDAEKRYRDAGYDKPRSYYEEEAVCDFMGEMLDNDRLLERVCWDANHRVLAAIRNVIDRILAAIGMADARLMHVRLTVSAAYNNAIRRTETEGEVPTKEGELRASLLRKHDVDRMSAEYHSGKKTGITKKVFDAAQKAMDAMYDMMMPYYEATALGKRMLPEERYGRKGAASTIFSNGSYGKTMENTLKCIRTLAYNEFTDDVKRALGRPLTQKESFLASQMVYDISSDPQCLYCYVSLDRKAYDEFLLRYMQQRDGVLGKFREMDASERAIGKNAPHTALPELYAEFLDKRKDTKQQQERFDMWIRNEIDGAETITAADISTADVRSAVLEGLDASMARQVKDAEKYAQSASWAKKDVDYISYVGELLKLSPAWIKKLTGEYGLRFYSFSEYTPAFLLENMQMVRDAALRGFRGLGYTKELDFVKVFAPTGMNINCSCYGRMDSEGNMQMDTRQGADWEEVKRLRGQYRNVGAVFVATNDAAVEWALAQDWIDVVIPFHIVRTGQDIADFYGWSNYSKEQADSVVGSSKKMYISPVEHKNDKAAFLAACEKHGVTPRFSKWLDNPNYMKLVNETRLSVDESSDLQPVFDMDAAADSWKRFVNTGGYYNGWWNVDAEGYADAVRTVVEDIRSGKMANEVDYGRQDVPANVEKMVAAARKKRIHGNVPLVDVYDRSGNALSSGEQRASLRKQKTGSSASEATEAERALRDELNNVLTRAGIEVVTDVEEGQRVLDEANVRTQKKKKKRKTGIRVSKYEYAIIASQITPNSNKGAAQQIYTADNFYICTGIDSNRNFTIETKIPIEGNQDKINKLENEFRVNSTGKGNGPLAQGSRIGGKRSNRSDVATSGRRGGNAESSQLYSGRRSESNRGDGLDRRVSEKNRQDLGQRGGRRGRRGQGGLTEEEPRFFRTSNGDAYGFTLNGKVYIDPRMVNAETPIHEYSHLWSTAIREQNPKEWKNIVELMKGTAVWDDVVRTYPELKTYDAIADEVLAQYSGRRGAERLRQETDAVLKSNSGITEKAAAVRAIRNVRSALNMFWRSVARMLGLRYTSAEDVADSVLRDMLNGKKPGGKPNWQQPKSRIELDNEKHDTERHYVQWVAEARLNPAKNYLDSFLAYPTEKYRTVFPTPTTEDYFLSTRTDFKTVPTDDVKGTWEEMKNSGKYEYTKSPLSNSEYLVDHETGDIYRLSDHWGPAASCYWTLDGFQGQRYTDETIAKSNIKDFDVWHNKKEKTVPREFHMREYAREVEQSITNYRDVLAKVPMTEAHRARFERGLAMLEDVQRRLEEGGYKPKKEDLKYMMGDSSETFQERQKRAVANKGTVMPGLNKAQVKVVDVPRHDYEGNWFEAVGKAVHDAIKKFTRIEKDEKGKEKRVSIPQHYNNFGAKFDYIISKKSIEESINEKQVKKSLEGEAPRGVHLAVLNNLDKVISESIEVEEHPDYIKKDGKRSPENGFKSDILVHRFIGAIRVDEKEYRVKTTMYEYKQTDRKSREYAYDVTKIEVLDDTTTSTSDDLVRATMGLKPLAKLLKDVEKSYDKGKKILEESKLADENAPVYREGESVDYSETDSESSEDYDLYRTVEDEDTIAFLEDQPSVTTYRSMVLIDGKLYPPMSSKESGSKQLRNPSELGKWEEAEEAPDKAYKKGNRWYFDLKKDNGKTVAGVAYNPYIHTSTTMLNDQFSEAQERDNLVVVEMHVPESELTSGYKADKAKDSVGAKQWKAGIIQGMLSGTREVILTRWAKPVRIVPVEEVADHIVGLIEGKVEVMPTNVVTPQQREALEERGVEFVETDNKGKMSAGVHKGKTWSSVYGKKAKSARKKNDSPSRIRKAVETLCKKLNLDNVEILDDASGLEGKRKKAKGFYNKKTGKITIVLSNATSVSDAVQTLLHEAVAHYGLRKMFGGNFDTFLDNVFRNADESVRRKISELSRKHDFDVRTATEEYLASLAEDTNFEKENAGWWKKVKSMFMDMLRNMGLNETMCSRCGMPFFGKQKHRTSLMETSALLMQNIRTFYQRSPMFCNFRTIASLPLQKKFLKKNLHFLHPPVKPLVFTGHSG